MRLSVKTAFGILAAFAIYQIYSNIAVILVESTNVKTEILKWQRFIYSKSSHNYRSQGREQQERPPSSVFRIPGNQTKLLSDHQQNNTNSIPSEWVSLALSLLGNATVSASLLRPSVSPFGYGVEQRNSSGPPWKSVGPRNASVGFRDGGKLLLSSAPGKVKLPVVRVSSSKGDNLTACPDSPPDLVGALQPVTQEQNVNSLQQQCQWVGHGGDYRPQNCRAGQRTAILVPYRNRWTHLHVLLANLLPFLRRQQADFTIFIIEQEPPSTFNRALLLNVGVLEASLRDLYTCFIFHDVDLIPLSDNHLYRCREQPKHFAVGINKFGYRLPYGGYVGGVAGLSRDQVEKINGNSNLYFGWGGEDDELLQRLQARGMKIVRDPPQISRYDMFKHTRDHGNEANPLRFKMLGSTQQRMDVDGLNSLKYNVTNVQVLPLYTWIKVKVDPQQLAQDSPELIREQLKTYLGQKSAPASNVAKEGSNSAG